MNKHQVISIIYWTVNLISDLSMHSNSKFKQLILPFMKRRTIADRSFSVVGLKY